MRFAANEYRSGLLCTHNWLHRSGDMERAACTGIRWKSHIIGMQFHKLAMYVRYLETGCFTCIRAIQFLSNVSRPLILMTPCTMLPLRTVFPDSRTEHRHYSSLNRLNGFRSDPIPTRIDFDHIAKLCISHLPSQINS